jgi:hypothetical protein
LLGLTLDNAAMASQPLFCIRLRVQTGQAVFNLLTEELLQYAGLTEEVSVE